MKTEKKILTRDYLLGLKIPIIFIPGLILASILGWPWVKDLAKIEKNGYQQSTVIFPNETKVTKVLDGDTIEIENGQMVRFLGIDAPEAKTASGAAATEYLRDLIEGKTVGLEYETGYQDDKFGRILAYVFEKCVSSLGCKDGKRLVNAVMVKKGLAKFVEYEDRRRLKYQNQLQVEID